MKHLPAIIAVTMFVGCALGDDIDQEHHACEPMEHPSPAACRYGDKRIVQFRCEPGVDLRYPTEELWSDCYTHLDIVCCRLPADYEASHK